MLSEVKGIKLDLILIHLLLTSNLSMKLKPSSHHLNVLLVLGTHKNKIKPHIGDFSPGHQKAWPNVSPHSSHSLGQILLSQI